MVRLCVFGLIYLGSECDVREFEGRERGVLADERRMQCAWFEESRGSGTARRSKTES